MQPFQSVSCICGRFWKGPNVHCIEIWRAEELLFQAEDVEEEEEGEGGGGGGDHERAMS